MSGKTNIDRYGIVNVNDASLARLTILMETCPLRFYAGSEVYDELLKISIALQDITRVRSETAQIIADGVSSRVFGLVASLLGIEDKGGAE